jgi:hypothetical protein
VVAKLYSHRGGGQERGTGCRLFQACGALGGGRLGCRDEGANAAHRGRVGGGCSTVAMGQPWGQKTQWLWRDVKGGVLACRG